MINEKFYDKWEEPSKSCFLTLRQIILDTNFELSETTKYGMPCFICESRPVLYLWSEKSTNEPYVLFAQGDNIYHPRLVSGTRKKMKVLPIDPNEDIPVETLEHLIGMSINSLTQKR